jgi:hypothetical protein
MLIEVQELHPAPAGKKLATVVTANGDRLGCWPEQLTQVQIGRRYNVEISERTWQGRTLQSITKITPYVNSDSAVAAKAAVRTAAQPASNGYESESGDAARQEQVWTLALLQSLIQAGHVSADKRQLWKATVMLRNLWHASFGRPPSASAINTFTPTEAGHRHHAAE